MISLRNKSLKLKKQEMVDVKVHGLEKTKNYNENENVIKSKIISFMASKSKCIDTF